MKEDIRAQEILQGVRKAGRTILTEWESREILSIFGCSVVKGKLADSPKESCQVAEEIGLPVAMKVVSPAISHKTDARCVRLGLDTPKKVEEAYREIVHNATVFNAEADIYGVLVEEMIDEGLEVIIGVTTDQTFGKCIMFGLGGIWAEAIKDVSFRVVPLSRLDAQDMVEEIRGYPVLKGIRGKAPRDLDSLYALLLKISNLAIAIKDIKEMDLNPVFVKEKGVIIADARIIV